MQTIMQQLMKEPDAKTIRMLQSRRGSSNGFSVDYYEAGKEYEVSELLGASMARKCWAEWVA